MLPKRTRLTPKKLVGEVIRRGRASVNNFFLLKTAPNGGVGNRYTVVVSSKVSKKAHERNFLKRRAREIVRLFQKETEAKGQDAVFIFRKEALSLSYRNLQNTMQASLSWLLKK